MIGIQVALVTALLLGSAPPQEPAPNAAPAPPTTGEVRGALERGMAYLLSSQRPDGSWGGPRNKTFTDSFANAATHDAWTVGTTGLVCVALLQAAEKPEELSALDRALDYLVENADVKRPAEWDIDNVWGYVYGLKAVALAYADPRFSDSVRQKELGQAARTFIAGLQRYQSPNGGWAYYANPRAAWRPEWATSFTTAAAVDALADARSAGLRVDDKMIPAALRAVERCRLPNGAYSYSVMAIPRTGRLTGIDQVKGSLGRIQVCNLAIQRAGDSIGEKETLIGLEQLFEHHRFLDVALRKPIPHEAYYANSAYFYLFAHYYAAVLISDLRPREQARFWPKLQREVMKTQAPDGGMWDFWISDHTKPYGTAFGVLALHLSLGGKR